MVLEPCPTFVNIYDSLCKLYDHLSKNEGKDQELIQSSTTPDPGHHIGKLQKPKKTSHTISPFPAGDHKAVRNTQDSMSKTKTNNKNHPQKHRL